MTLKISEAVALATKYSEEAHTEYWRKGNEKNSKRIFERHLRGEN